MTSCVRTVDQSCLCADNIPFFYVTPLSILWLDDGYNNAICHLFCIFFSGCIPSSTYLFLIAILANYSNPTNVLKNSRRAIVVCNRLILISPVTPHPSLLSVLFVDNLQVCTPKAVCSFLWLCVQHGHRECICTDVRFDFQSPCLLFYIVQSSLSFFTPFIFWFL